MHLHKPADRCLQGSILFQPDDLDSIRATIPVMKSLEPRVVIFLGYVRSNISLVLQRCDTGVSLQYDSQSIFFTYCAMNDSDVFGKYTFVGVDGWIGALRALALSALTRAMIKHCTGPDVVSTLEPLYGLDVRAHHPLLP